MRPTPESTKDQPPVPDIRLKRSWLRKLLPYIAILLVLLFCAPLALGLSPVKNYVADKVSRVVGRKVDIGSASAFWFSGINLKDVTVHSPAGFPEPLARIGVIHADVDLLALLGGKVEADVRIERPHVVLEKRVLEEHVPEHEGRTRSTSNFEGLFPDQGDGQDEDRKPPHVVVRVLDGRIESRGGGDLPASTLGELRAHMQLVPDGSLRAELHGTLGAAGPAQQDVSLSSFVDLDAGGSGPIALASGDLIDLAPVSSLIARSADLKSLKGAARVFLKGHLHDKSRFSGKLKVLLEQIEATTHKGNTIAASRVRAAANLVDEAGQQATRGRVYVIADDVHAQQEAHEGSREFTEKLVELTFEGRMQPASGGDSSGSSGRYEIGIDRASARAGETLKVRSAGPIDIKIPRGGTGSPVVEGEFTLDADLGRLSNLRGFVPALAALESGHVVARVDSRDMVAADGVHGANLRVGARVANLTLSPSATLPKGLQEPDASVQFQCFVGDDGTTRVQVHEATSSVLTSRKASSALEILMPHNSAPSIAGPFDFTINLARLTEIVGAHMGLGERELISGMVTLQGTGRGNADHGEIEATIRSEGLAWPKRWALTEGPSEISGKFMAARNGEALRASLETISALGCTISGNVDLQNDDNGTWNVGHGTADVRGDLQQVRALRSLLGLEPDATLAGEFRYRAEVQPGESGFTILRGALRIAGLNLQMPSKSIAITEPTLGVDHVVSLPPEGQRGRIDLVQLDSQTLNAKVSGGSFALRPTTDLQGHIELSGLAGRLAPYLRTALGEDYKDLEGDGALQGTIELSSGPGPYLGNLGVQANLQLGAWSSGGIAINNTVFTAKRGGPADPLHMTLQAGVNGGGLGMSAAMRLGEPAKPWVARAQLRGVDTSDWVVSDGAARGMSYALPVLLPADGGGGVLSGRLNADVTARASDLASPVLMDSLTGKGTVGLQDGEIKGSALFGGGASGGQGLGKIVGILTVAAPVVGRVLGEAAKALAFQRIDSRFTIAQRVINVEKIEVAGQVLSILMKGRVGLNKAVHMNADITLGDAGEIVKRVLPGAKIPMQIRGTLDEPVVIPRVDAKSIMRSGLLDGVRKNLPGGRLPKNPLDALGGAVGR